VLAGAGVRVVVHRGDCRRAAENSLGAIREAAHAGADFAEVDVRTTRDGALVLMHDRAIDRTTDRSGWVSRLTLAQMRVAKLVAPDPAYDGELVPTLAEAIEVAAQVGIGLYLDVKDAAPDALVNVMRTRPGNWLVYREADCGFLEEVRSLDPTALLLIEVGSEAGIPALAHKVRACGVASTLGDFEASLGPEARTRRMPAFVDVLGTGPDLEERIHEAVGLGAQAVMVDDIETALRVLR
jgi:glycerophosphoryl diester phosphodiesterase